MKTKRILGIILSILLVIGGLSILICITSFLEVLIGVSMGIILTLLILLAMWLLMS